MGPLLRQPMGCHLLDGFDPEILDLPVDTTGAHLKEMYQLQRCDYDAAKAKFDQSGSHDNQFANLVGSEFCFVLSQGLRWAQFMTICSWFECLALLVTCHSMHTCLRFLFWPR